MASVTPMIDPGKDFVIIQPYAERYDATDPQLFNVIEDPEEEVNWYNRYFLPNAHYNYLGQHAKLGGIVVVSIVHELIVNSGAMYRVLVWREKEVTHHYVPMDMDATPTFKDIVRAIDPELYNHCNVFHKVEDPKILNELKKMEEAEPKGRKKIGVLFAKEGQVDETEMFGNEHGSPAFEELLNLLGERVELLGFKGFCAQLDVKNGQTGTHSVATHFRQFEVMYHVSTLLPYFPRDPQQVQRKRHIGNDIIMVVFVEGTTPYKAECVASKYTNVIAVVQPAEDPTEYKVSFCYKRGVPAFGPPVCTYYKKDETFVNALLTKCINGERATCVSPEFMVRKIRTQRVYLDMLYSTFYNDAKKDMKLTQVLSLGAMARVTRAMQGSVSGHPQIFNANLVIENFPHEVTCVDRWGTKLFVGTEQGVFYLDNPSASPQLVVDTKGAKVEQLIILIEINQLLVRTDNELTYFMLDNVISVAENVSHVVLQKAHIFRVRRVQTRFVLAAALQYQVCLFFWNAESATWEPIRRITMAAKPSTLSIFKTNYVVVGIKHGFVREHIPGEEPTLTLHEGMKTDVPMAAFDVSGNALLCFEKHGVFCDRNGREDVNVSAMMRWQARPMAFILYGPCLIYVTQGFTSVVSVTNGTAIETHPIGCPYPYDMATHGIYVPSRTRAKTHTIYSLLPAQFQPPPTASPSRRTASTPNGMAAAAAAVVPRTASGAVLQHRLDEHPAASGDLHPDDTVQDESWLDAVNEMFPELAEAMPAIQMAREASLQARRRHSISHSDMHAEEDEELDASLLAELQAAAAAGPTAGSPAPRQRRPSHGDLPSPIADRSRATAAEHKNQVLAGVHEEHAAVLAINPTSPAVPLTMREIQAPSPR